MRLIRFSANGEVFAGQMINDMVRTNDASQREFSSKEIRLLPPCLPSKVVAVGLNYRDHAEELGLAIPEEPILFMKPSTSVIGPDDMIILPPQSTRVDYEAELAIVMSKSARNVPREKAQEYILGFTCLNDVTARDLQSKDGQWTRSKSFDTFCPIGPWIDTEIDASDLKIELVLNGEIKQKSRTSNLIFNCAVLVEFISAVMTLHPGDVIATGTTSGIGPMGPGDTVEVRVEGIGSLVNRTVKSAP